MNKQLLIGLITLPIIFVGCSKQSNSNSVQEIYTIPSSNLQIKTSEIGPEKAILEGSRSFSNIPDSLAPAEVRTLYYFSPTENDIEMSHIKWFLGDQRRMTDFSETIEFNVGIGATADFNSNYDNYLVVLNIIRPLDETKEPLRIWTIKQINWTPNQRVDLTW